ncbi:MAG TPA: hypothetical protein VI407_05385, partial [Erythrobacter sp.]
MNWSPTKDEEMITWFKKHAPIRRKMTVLIVGNGVLGMIDVMAAWLSMQGIISQITALVVAFVTMLLLTVKMLAAKEWISGAYVDTVVRMEGLAAGDITSPILHREYT